ncbi:MAG: hypothetical protein ACR2OO_10400 [Thermomicrobiales bacterium]
MKDVTAVPKIADYALTYHGFWDADPEGVCRVRVFDGPGANPVLVLTDAPDNPSTSVTNLVKTLAAEQIAKHFPHRFDHVPPAVVIQPGRLRLVGPAADHTPGSRSPARPGAS